MAYAAATSPFAKVNDEPWVLWSNKQNVTSLQTREWKKQTNNTAQDEVNAVQQPMPTPTYGSPPQIHRTQYNSVLSRMKQATKNSSKFAAWTT